MREALNELSIKDLSDPKINSIEMLSESVLEIIKECNVDDKEEVYFGMSEAVQLIIKENPDIQLLYQKPMKEEQKNAIENITNKEAEQMGSKIKDSITAYEAVAKKQEEIGENTMNTQNVVEILKKTLNELNGKFGNISKAGKIENKRIKGLKEIFYFYTRTQMLLGRRPTFDDIINELNTMNMVEFMKFAKDFNIPISVYKLRDSFKKQAHLSREMRIEHFLQFMPIIAQLIKKEKMTEIKRKISEQIKKINSLKENLETTMRTQTPRKVKNGKTDGNISERKVANTHKKESKKKEGKKEEGKKDSSIKLATQIKESESKLNDRRKSEAKKSERKKTEEKKTEERESKNIKEPDIEKLETPKHIEVVEEPLPIKIDPKQNEINIENELLNSLNEEYKKLDKSDNIKIEEDFYNYLNCDDSNKYRKKMSAIGLPFGIKDKNFRIPCDKNEIKHRYKSEKTSDEIKEGVQMLKEKRNQLLKLKEMEKEETYNKNREIMKSLYQKIKQESNNPYAPAVKQPTIQKSMSSIVSRPKIPSKVKLTIKDLQKMSFQELNANVSQNIIEEIDEGDDIEVFRKFNIISEKEARNLKHKYSLEYLPKNDVELSPILNPKK